MFLSLLLVPNSPEEWISTVLFLGFVGFIGWRVYKG